MKYETVESSSLSLHDVDAATTWTPEHISTETSIGELIFNADAIFSRLRAENKYYL